MTFNLCIKIYSFFSWLQHIVSGKPPADDDHVIMGAENNFLLRAIHRFIMVHNT